MLKLTPLKTILALELAVVLLVVFGFAPREASLALLGVMIYYLIFSSLEEGVILLVASIPIFIALPISSSMDSLSSARVVVLVLFLKWLYEKRGGAKKFLRPGNIVLFIRRHPLILFTLLFFFVLSFSVGAAEDKGAAIRKIIYLMNLSAVAILVREAVLRRGSFLRVEKAALFSGALVLFVAIGQLASVYFLRLGDFWTWWANHFSVGFYGENLKQIVLEANAWFAVSPVGTTAIRAFGSFTDPHSFALYLLLLVPFIGVRLFSALPDSFKDEFIPWRFFWRNKIERNFKKPEFLIWLGALILVLFFVILSGTRGILLTAVAGSLAGFWLAIKRKDWRRSASLILISLFIFIFLIPVVSVFNIIPQFKAGADSAGADLLLKRLSSILDFDETSNKGRLFIWGESLKSAAEHPWLGVGIGNFPRVLNQDIELARAGSSAHNIYLNFLVEGGIFSLILIFFILGYFLTTILAVLNNSDLSFRSRLLMVGFFVYFIWAFCYSLFDIALMDERVFLLFMTILGIIYAIREKSEIVQKHE